LTLGSKRTSRSEPTSFFTQVHVKHEGDFTDEQLIRSYINDLLSGTIRGKSILVFIPVEFWLENLDLAERAIPSLSRKTLHVVQSALNGNNGEWTNTDDVKGKAKKMVNENKEILRLLTQMAVGKETYSQAARGVKLARKLVKTKKKRSVPRGPKASKVYGITMESNGRIFLSQQASRYMLACMDSFDARATGASTCHGGPSQSHKFTCFGRGSFATQANGFGFVMLSPTLANDYPAVYSTNGTGGVTVCTTPNNWPIPTNGVNQASYDTPYSSFDFASTATDRIINSRIVSATLKVTYTGSVLEAAGTQYVYKGLDNTPVKQFTVAMLGSKKETVINSVSKHDEKAVIDVIASSDTQCDFSNDASSLAYVCYHLSGDDTYTGYNMAGTSGIALGEPLAVIAIDGAVGLSFFYEVAVQCEVTGNGAIQSALSQSISDTVGSSVVRDVVNSAESDGSSQPLKQRIKRAMERKGVVMCDVSAI
jgi:hypothetical protein